MLLDKMTSLRATQISATDLTCVYGDIELQHQDNAIRIYKSSPAGCSLQLRAYGPITRKGKNRRIIVTASYLGADVIDQLIEQLQAVKADFR